MRQIQKIFLGSLLVLTLSVVTLISTKASDHDDGEMELKGRNLNLTDLYAFRENWQDRSASSENLILIMNTNPRSLGRQQYFFSTTARYEFHLSRIGASDKSTAPRGSEDVVLRFEFGSPDANNRQPIRLTTIRDGQTLTADVGMTTTLADAAAGSRSVTTVELGGKNLTVFAGLREDPFFFDVEAFFRVRGALSASQGDSIGSGFKPSTTAQDFTTGYNVNSIVLRVPISFLQSVAQEPIFDIWETVSIPE